MKFKINFKLPNSDKTLARTVEAGTRGEAYEKVINEITKRITWLSCEEEKVEDFGETIMDFLHNNTKK